VSGDPAPAGKYRVEQRLVDVVGNVLDDGTVVDLSRQALVWRSARITLPGRGYRMTLTARAGTVAPVRSRFSNGVLLSSGRGAAGVQYLFTIPSADAYRSVTFQVHGRSPNGRKAVISIWNPALDGYRQAGSFDAAKRAGPAQTWYDTKASADSHREARSVRASVIVVNAGARVDFDVAAVRLICECGVLQ
jgi:hypothetical protein